MRNSYIKLKNICRRVHQQFQVLTDNKFDCFQFEVKIIERDTIALQEQVTKKTVAKFQNPNGLKLGFIK